MKHHERFSDWPSFNRFNPSLDRQPMAKVRKLAHRLHTLGGSIDSDLREAIEFVRSGRAPVPPDASTRELVKALADKELSVRADAAYQLGMRKDAPVEPLLKALNDEQRFVRAEAARSLGTLGERVPIAPLVTALHDKDGSVRVAATQALGMLGKRVSLEDLLPTLSDSWPPVREAAVLALGKREEQVPLKTFLAALEDEDKFVRVAALSVLGTLENCVVIEPLVAALGDEQKQVRKAALQALLAQGKRVPLQVLKIALKKSKWPLIRKVAAKVLSMLGKRDPLKQYASDHDPACSTAKPTRLRRSRVPTFAKTALLGGKKDSAETVKSRYEHLVKSKIGRFIARPSVNFIQVYIADWAKQNKTVLLITSTMLCTSIVLYHRKNIISTVLSNALRIYRLPRALTDKYVRSQKTSTIHL